MTQQTLDDRAFRNAMAQFASGVTVVTTRDGNGRFQGFTASAFCSLSLDPPLVLVCLEKRAHCYEAFVHTSHIAISVLASGQLDLAWHFATKQEDKFERIAIEPGPVTGLPLIPGATVHLECEMHDRLDGGDHTILIARVLRAESTDQPPLVHFNRRFGDFAPAS